MFFGCMLCVCGCGGMCCRGVGEESPVFFGRAGQLFGVRGQVAVCVSEQSGDGVGGKLAVLLSVNVCSSHKHVLSDGCDTGFMMKVMGWCRNGTSF